MKTTIKTTLHLYSFNTDNPEDREPWYQLELKLRKTHGRGHRMHAIKSNQDFNPEPGPVELETEFLFQNQWNTDKGRLFDWYEEAVFCNGKQKNNIKRGHYLDITPEMVAIRRNTLKCCYTGNQFFFDADKDGEAPKFNLQSSALGNCYLKESELHLVRLKQVCDDSSPAPLTKEERDFLLPLYIKAQSKRVESAKPELRKAILDDYEKELATITTERDGKLWLLDHGVNDENCIYYSHTRRFCFGWRSAYPKSAVPALLECLKRFPFEYDVKSA